MAGEYRSTVFASCFVQFVATLSLSFVNAFLTLFIFYDLGVSSLAQAALWSGLSGFVASTGLAIVSPFWGWLTDKYGARLMMVRVLAFHSLLTGLVAFAGNVETVLVLRAIRGVMGGTSIVALAAIASASKKEELPKAVGYQQSAQILGGIIGPAFGAVAAPVLGFRACFLISAAAIACAIPLALVLKWPEGQGVTAERPNVRGIVGMRKEIIAMFLARASVNYLTPILPVYLNSAGVSEENLTTYTGIVLTLSNLAFALSVPLTSRLVARRKVPLLLGFQTGAILVPGLAFSVPLLITMRACQMVLYSPAPVQLMSAASESRADRGVAMGVIGSARFAGGAVSPMVSSTTNYLLGLAPAFGVMALLSLLAAFATWRVLGGEGEAEGKVEPGEVYLDDERSQ